VLLLCATTVTATCGNFCRDGETRKTPFKTRVANAKDLVVVEVTSEPEPRPAIGHAGEFSYVYTATVRRVLKGCLTPGTAIRIHQIRKSSTIVAGCPNPELGQGAEISIWTGKAKRAQALRSSPVPRLLTPVGGMFLLSGCRLLKDPEVFFLNPCGIAQAVSTDWELVAVAGNENVRSLLGPGTWTELAVLNEKTATVQSIWSRADGKRTTACGTTSVWCSDNHPSSPVDVETFKAHRLGLNTDGGKWVATEYKKSPDGDGCIMNLEFIPKDTVRGTKIALIQRNLKIEKGTNYDTTTRDKVMKWRQNQQLAQDLRSTTVVSPLPVERRKDARGDGVSHIDRAVGNNNPIYGAPDLRLGNPGDALDATPVGDWNPGQIDRSKPFCNYQLGGVTGTTVRAARLYDMPLCLGCIAELERSLKAKEAAKVSSFTFETTAVVVEGPDTGRYLGSVRWGFEISDALCVADDDDVDAFKCHTALLPFTVVSQDKASDDMKRVIAAWNQGFFSYDNPDAPTNRNPQVPVVP
jgi:hypothetical protein